jgi:Uma2 family endonuclease/predicted RNase H-like HicB family nuclease
MPEYTEAEKQEADDAIDRWIEVFPESKLEIIDGQLIVGTLKGSRFILWNILKDYGPDIVLPMVPPEQWWEAIIQAFKPDPLPQTPEEWSRWADQISWHFEPEPAGPCVSAEHRRIYELLDSGLRYVASVSGQGRTMGHDFVVRLEDNGFTPDILYIDRNSLDNLHEYYFEGPPSLVIEVTLKGSAETDRTVKRRYYEQAGISEYWLIESESMKANFFRLGEDGRYHEVFPDAEGFYYSSAAKGLGLSLPLLERMHSDYNKRPLPFVPVKHFEPDPVPEHKYNPDDLGWDSIPFVPRIGLKPVPIRFEEFISWCPRAKFESYGLGIVIECREGTRRTAAMLMMTLGLTETVKMLHPREWVMFLTKERYQSLVRKYAEPLLRNAQYQKKTFREEPYFSGKLPQMPFVYAHGDTLEECRQDMEKIVSTRVLLKLARREDMDRFLSGSEK